MITYKRKLGDLGENLAEKFLVAKNYKIIKRNFHCRFGEIDIIAVDYSKVENLVFIEVKTRRTSLFGTPEESITHLKINKILKTALYFLNSSSQKLPYIWRVDVIGIELNERSGVNRISHLKNVTNGT